MRHSFVSPLLIYNSKTSITQKRFLCPIHQDAGDFHTSTQLKVGGLEHMEEVEPEEEQRQCP